MTEKHANHITKLHFKFKNATPGALRYYEVDDTGAERTTDNAGAVIGTLYLRKAAMNGAQPLSLTIDLDSGIS